MPYRVRVSGRARRPSVAVCVYDGITVTLPTGFDERRVPRLLKTWRPWIDQQVRKANDLRRSLPPDSLEPLPSTVRLAALNRSWIVVYRAATTGPVRLTEAVQELRISGPDREPDDQRRALRRWLARRARALLEPWTAQLAAEHGFGYNKLTIRGQRSRWGSYSSTGTLSLNYLLLFLEPELVRCVILHELCHTRYMSHGPRFHGLLRRLEPNYAELDARINEAWHAVPFWAWQK